MVGVRVVGGAWSGSEMYVVRCGESAKIYSTVRVVYLRRAGEGRDLNRPICIPLIPPGRGQERGGGGRGRGKVFFCVWCI